MTAATYQTLDLVGFTHVRGRTEQVVAFPDAEFERFFLANYERLVNSLTAVVGDREVARDCVQEAFIKASTRWRRIRRYDDPASWVRRVAINRGRDVHRAGQRRKRRETLVAPHETESVPDNTGRVADSMRLVELLNLLPKQQRIAASLFYVEDLSISEISESIGISKGAVKFHLNQARSTLRAAIEHEEYRYG